MVKKYLICIVLVLVSNAALASVPLYAQQQRSAGVFGIIIINQDGREEFKITNTVPLVVDQSYGWIIKLDSELPRVKWQEVFELPAKPDIWDSGDISREHEIYENGRVSVMEREVDVEGGYIQNFWSVAAGDPAGDYVIRVYINDVLLEIFRFEVVKLIDMPN